MRIRISAKKSFPDLLFGLAFYPWIIAWMLTSTYFKDILHPYFIIRVWQNIGIVMLLLKLYIEISINRSAYRKNLLYTSIIIVISYIVSYGGEGNGNASFVFYSFLLILFSYNLNRDHLVFRTCLLQSCILFITVFSSLIGIIPDYVSLSNAGGIYRLRHSLGYTYCTYVSNYFLSIVIELYYLKLRKKSKWKLWQYALILFLNIIVYQYTKTRMAFVLVLFIFMVEIYQRIVKKYRMGVLFYFMCRYSFISLFLLSLILTVLYNPSNALLRYLNNLLSQRIRFAQSGISTWGISLFGSSVEWSNMADTYNYVDSSYINILICYGVLILMFVIVGLTITMWRASKIRDVAFCTSLLFWAIKAMIDPQLFLLWFNPFMFFISDLIKEKVTGVEKNDFHYLSIQ